MTKATTMSSKLARKARQKKQTRLTFDPVDRSSSPAVKMTSAKVRYELPARPTSGAILDDSESDDILSSGKYDLRGASLRNKGATKLMIKKTLPTPRKSSQVQIDDDESPDTLLDDEPSPILPLQTRQSTQNFKPILPPLSSSKKKGKITNIEVDINSSDGSSAEDEPITPSKRKAKGKSKAKLPKASQKILPGKRKEKDISVPLPSDSDDDLLTPGGSKRPILLESLSEDDDLIVSSPKRSQKPIYKESEESSEEDIKSSPLKRRQRSILQVHQDDDDEDDSEPILSPLKRNRPLDGSDDEDISPAKRRRTAPEDDLSSSPPSAKTSSRQTRQKIPKRHRTVKEKQMELLKRKRLGEKIEILTDSGGSESEEESGDDQFQALSEFSDEEESPEVVKKTKAQPETGDEEDVANDSDFVIDDDDGPIGVPTHLALMPLQFTHAAHKPLKEHFRDAVEWMVHNKINPAFDRKDEIYSQAFKKLDDECYGLAKSKFSSTQWTKEFTRALYARPHFITGDLAYGEGYDLAGIPKCDACNHRNHKPTSFVQFGGKPYDKNSLEDLDQGSDDEEDSNPDSSSDSDDSDDSKGRDVDVNGLSIANEDTRWCCGSVCKANAQQSHTLLHWKYALNEWVVDVLARDGELKPSKLAERDKMKRKRLNKYTNKLVDSWEQSGRIKDLYRDFKGQLETARELEAGKRGGWR